MFVKIHQTVQLKWVDFIICKLHINKADLKLKKEKYIADKLTFSTFGNILDCQTSLQKSNELSSAFPQNYIGFHTTNFPARFPF